ncbi:hypothetical protein LSH36_294g03003 [Paralvinella palmiformis]|uniref:Uncharacterized protein n=1 Tax=Paralvinella palmiformis TaxID=53620 RepID=A0AAD9N3C9_9ANNE|nr:hypothetical protein LSH36_294g03003 [Paralvinella palmiformis]
MPTLSMAGDALEYRVCAIPCISECKPMQCCSDRKKRKAPAIFRTCCHRQDETHSDTYKEVMICPDESKPLITLPYCSVGNGICPDGSHVTSIVTTVTGCDAQQTSSKPLILNVGSLTDQHQGSASIESRGSSSQSQLDEASENKYKPLFHAPLRMLRRPKSMCDVPVTSYTEYAPRRTVSSDAIKAQLTDKNGTEEKLVLGDIAEGANSPRALGGSQDAGVVAKMGLLPDCATSDTRLNQAIICLRNDLKSIRGEVASKESILNE